MTPHLAPPHLSVALSSIFWRESWKYGERAYRYCQHDIGHALAALSLAARLSGWRLVCQAAADDDIAAAFGFERTPWPAQEAEEPAPGRRRRSRHRKPPAAGIPGRGGRHPGRRRPDGPGPTG